MKCRALNCSALFCFRRCSCSESQNGFSIFHSVLCLETILIVFVREVMFHFCHSMVILSSLFNSILIYSTSSYSTPPNSFYFYFFASLFLFLWFHFHSHFLLHHILFIRFQAILVIHVHQKICVR